MTHHLPCLCSLLLLARLQKDLLKTHLLSLPTRLKEDTSSWDGRNMRADQQGLGRAATATLGHRKAVTRGALAFQCFRHSASQRVSKASQLYQLSFKGFPHSSVDKQSACNAGDPGSIPGWARSPGEGNGNPLQYSCLENPQGQRSLAGYSPWGCKSRTPLSDSTATLNHIIARAKVTEPLSSVCGQKPSNKWPGR